MPRGPRIYFENAFYHVFNRGLNKERIFRKDDDYRTFLQRLQDLKRKKRYDHSIFAYVLMPNHFHILIQTKSIPIGKIMSSLSTSYAMYFNLKYKRVGMLFQNRFKSNLCQKDEYFLNASRYIHLNPVAAGLVRDIDAYAWSSYQELFGNSDFHILDVSEITRLIGESAQEKDQYRRFVLDGMLIYEEIEKEYQFNRDIAGNPKFYSLSQKKYLRWIKKHTK
jgi:putative transposase